MLLIKKIKMNVMNDSIITNKIRKTFLKNVKVFNNKNII